VLVELATRTRSTASRSGNALGDPPRSAWWSRTNFDAETLAAAIDFVAGEIASICAGVSSDVTAVHDVGAGGLATALAEMVAVSQLGAGIVELEGHAELFSEFPAASS